MVFTPTQFQGEYSGGGGGLANRNFEHCPVGMWDFWRGVGIKAWGWEPVCWTIDEVKKKKLDAEWPIIYCKMSGSKFCPSPPLFTIIID